MELEKRKIQREEARKARDAMEALEMAKNTAAMPESDVVFVVCWTGAQVTCRAYVTGGADGLQTGRSDQSAPGGGRGRDEGANAACAAMTVGDDDTTHHDTRRRAIQPPMQMMLMSGLGLHFLEEALNDETFHLSPGQPESLAFPELHPFSSLEYDFPRILEHSHIHHQLARWSLDPRCQIQDIQKLALVVEHQIVVSSEKVQLLRAQGGS